MSAPATVSTTTRSQVVRPAAPPFWRRPETWGGVAVPVVAIVLWYLASLVIFVVPDPWETLVELVSMLGDPSYREALASTAVATAEAAVIGILLGGALGLALGLSARLREIFDPFIVALNSMPKIVLYPVLLPLFGLAGSKVVMGVLFALFPVLINVASAARNLPPIYGKLSRSLRMSRLQYILRIVLPAVRRPALTGVRLAISLALVAVVLSEFFATDVGLGRHVLWAYGHAEYPQMFASIMLLVVSSLVISLVLMAAEKRVN